ncbi:MAG: hypothetical protein M3N13_09040 [Candidatus Eremiobacteraeota bacterium]|nr:hypothetical protein [Candidatus Eremiobacteraeota bacterium]
MPRQIIDTESSRPAYVRRLSIRWIVAIVFAIAAFFAVLELLRSHPLAAATSLLLFQGKLLPQGNQGPIPHDRRVHAA